MSNTHPTNIPSEQGSAAASIPQQQIPVPSNQPIKLTEEQSAKLQSEIDVVQGNMRVFSEMLAYLTSSENQGPQKQDTKAGDLELLTVRNNGPRLLRKTDNFLLRSNCTRLAKRCRTASST